MYLRWNPLHISYPLGIPISLKYHQTSSPPTNNSGLHNFNSPPIVFYKTPFHHESNPAVGASKLVGDSDRWGAPFGLGGSGSLRRLCNEPYDLGDLDNRQRHISNWYLGWNGARWICGRGVGLTVGGGFVYVGGKNVLPWVKGVRVGMKKTLGGVVSKISKFNTSFVV